MGLALAQACGSALRASHFLLLRQKKVSKEKATPRSAPGVARSLALLGRPGGWLNSPAAQTTPADCPRPACVAQRLPRGPEKRPRSSISPQKISFHGQPPEQTQNNPATTSSTPALHLPLKRGRPGGGLGLCLGLPFSPLKGAEQRRPAGEFRFAMFEPQASSGKPPGLPSSARNRQSRRRPRGGLFFGYFLLATKRKYARPPGGTPKLIKPKITVEYDEPALRYAHYAGYSGRTESSPVRSSTLVVISLAQQGISNLDQAQNTILRTKNQPETTP